MASYSYVYIKGRLLKKTRMRGLPGAGEWVAPGRSTEPDALKRNRRLAKAKIVNEYDQEIPQSQTADNPVAPRGRAAQPSRDTRKTN